MHKFHNKILHVESKRIEEGGCEIAEVIVLAEDKNIIRFKSPSVFLPLNFSKAKGGRTNVGFRWKHNILQVE